MAMNQSLRVHLLNHLDYVVFKKTNCGGQSGSNEAINESMNACCFRWFLEKRMDGKTTSAFVLGILDRLAGCTKSVSLHVARGPFSFKIICMNIIILQFFFVFLEEFLKEKLMGLAGREQGAK